MRDWANAIRPYNFSHHSVGANRIRPRLYSPPSIFAPICIRPCLYSSNYYSSISLFVYIIISLNKCPLGECDSPLQYFRIIPLTSLSGHIQLDEYIMGECDSPLHWHAYIYLFRIPYGRIAFAPISIRPIYFPTTSRINLKTPLHTPKKT